MDDSEKASGIPFNDKDLLRVLKLKTCSRGVSGECSDTAAPDIITLKYCSEAMATAVSAIAAAGEGGNHAAAAVAGSASMLEIQETVAGDGTGNGSGSCCTCKHYCGPLRGLAVAQGGGNPNASDNAGAAPSCSNDNESEGVKCVSYGSLDYWQRQTADLTARLSESVAMNEELRRQMQQMAEAAAREGGGNSWGEGGNNNNNTNNNNNNNNNNNSMNVNANTTGSRSKHLCYWRRLVEEISKQLIDAKARESKLMGELEVERGCLGQTAGGGSMSGDELREIVGEGMTAEELLKKIQRTELLLTLTLRHAPIVITHSDLDLRYTFIYNAPPTWKPQDVIGKSDDELMGLVPGGSDIKTMKQAVLETGQTKRQEIKFDLPEWGPVWYIVSCEPLRNKAGKTVGVINVLVDITEEAISRERLAKLREEMAVRDVTERELRRTIKLADEAIAAKNNFLAVMSHEIRTPLNGVLGMAQVLATTGLDAEQKELVDAMIFSGDVLLAIISDTLDLSKLESTQLDLEERELRPREVVKHVVSTAIAATRGRNVLIQGHVADNVPLTVIGDPLRVKQVITNLVFNAVKFTKKGHILVRVKALDSSGEAQRSNEEVSMPAPKAVEVYEKIEAMTKNESMRKGMVGKGQEGERKGAEGWETFSGRSLATVKSEVLGLLEEGVRLKGGLNQQTEEIGGIQRLGSMAGVGKEGGERGGKLSEKGGEREGLGGAEKGGSGRKGNSSGASSLEVEGGQQGGERLQGGDNARVGAEGKYSVAGADDLQMAEAESAGEGEGKAEGEGGDGESERPGEEGEGKGQENEGGMERVPKVLRRAGGVERQGSGTGKRLKRTFSSDERGVKKAGRKRVKFDGGKTAGGSDSGKFFPAYGGSQETPILSAAGDGRELKEKKYWEDDDVRWAWNNQREQQRQQENDEEDEEEEASLRVNAGADGEHTTSTEEGEHLWLQFEIEDTGIGIPKSAFPTLFEKFTQVHTSTTRNYGGTGLGLAICKQLVELMKGQISVRSRVGVGTTFTFTVRCRVLFSNKEPDDGGDPKLAKSNSNSLARFRKLQAGMSFMSPHAGAPLGIPVWEDEKDRREGKEEGGSANEEDPERREELGRLKGATLGESLEMEMKKEKGDGVRGGRTVASCDMEEEVEKGGRQERAKVGESAGKGGRRVERESSGEGGKIVVQGVREGQSGGPGKSESSLKPQTKEGIGGMGERRTHERERKWKPRLLLAEDNKVNVMVALSMLKRLGLEADVAYHGVEAIRAIQSKHYDLVLMDICMPIMDGLEVTKRVRSFEKTGLWDESDPLSTSQREPSTEKDQDSSASSALGNSYKCTPSYPPAPEFSGHTKLSATNASKSQKEGERVQRRHLPIVAMTANALADCESQCSANGMDGFITKPITFKKLSDALQVYLDFDRH